MDRIELSAIDSNFISLDSETNQQVIAAYCICEGTPREEVLRQQVSQALELFPRLRFRLSSWLTPVWVKDPNFSLDRHLEVRDFPEFLSIDDLSAAAATVFSERLPEDRPLWRFVILRGKSPTEDPHKSRIGGLIFQIHHALADGLGGLEVLHKVCTEPVLSETLSSDLLSSDLRSSETISTANEAGDRKRTNRTRRERTRKIAAALPRSGDHRTLGSLQQFFKQLLSGKTRSAVNGSNSTLRKIAVIDLPLNTLKQLRAVSHASLNDLLLTLVTGAMRRYSERVASTPVDLTAIIPYNLRASIDRTALGNQLTGVGFKLPVTAPEPLTRLSIISSIAKGIRQSGSFGALGIAAKINHFAPPLLRQFLARTMARRMHLICTNMPGPRELLLLGGVPMLSHYGCAALMQRQGIAFAFLSYAGRINTAVVTDAAIVPDPSVITELLNEALSELIAAFDKSSVQLSAQSDQNSELTDSGPQPLLTLDDNKKAVNYRQRSQ